jgi:hypothetical protein
MIRIYDANNWYRRLLETDTTGSPARNTLIDTFTAPCPVIFVWDGAKGNDRRRATYPDYKMNRGAVDQSIYDGFRFLQSLLVHSPAIQVRVPGYEADDVVATLAKRFAKAGSDIEIYSNDADFLQLGADHPRIFCGARAKDDIPGRDIRLYKTTVGDPVDNIKGIKGFGKTSWPLVDKGALRRMILEDGPVPEMRPAAARWADENRDQLKVYWEIVGFYDVPGELIDQHMTAGDRDFQAADDMLQRFFQ